MNPQDPINAPTTPSELTPNTQPHQVGQTFTPQGQASVEPQQTHQAPQPAIAAQPQPMQAQAQQSVALEPVAYTQTPVLPNQQAMPQPQMQIQPAHVPQQPQPMNTAPQKKSKKKPLLLALGGSALFTAAIAAFFVFSYLPNTPDNIWRRGVASIGVGLETLAEDESIQPSNATKVTGEFNLASPTEASATFTSVAGLSGIGSFDFDGSFGEFKPQVDLYYSVLAEEYPELYFKVDGFDEIVTSFLGVRIDDLTGGEKFEKVWWNVDYGDLIDTGLLSESEVDEIIAESDPENGIAAEDLVAVSNAVIQASSKYLFTADTENMVLQQVEDLGVEDYEGVDSRKYLVEVNKDNLKSYLKEIRNNIDATGVLEKVGSTEKLSKAVSDEDIDEMVDDIELDKVTIEAWVSLDNKVLRNIRFTPVEEPETGYVDVSLLLDGTSLDIIPLRVKVVGSDETGEGEFVTNWITNVATNSTEISMLADFTFKDGSDDVKFDAKVVIEGLSEEPAIAIPTPSRSFTDLINSISEDTQRVLGISTSSSVEEQSGL